ncbi:MAG: VWA domain-containing protein [Candidatus Freyarchaeum deiterrae]
MFKTSFNKILERKATKEDLPYVASLSFEDLEKPKEVIVGKPIQCQKCGGVLTDPSSVKKDPKIGTHFKCAFCGAINVVDPKDLPAHLIDDVDFIIEEAMEIKTTKPALTGDNIVAVIDVSGSMSGGKLEAVKHSLAETIKDLKVNAPQSKFGLIAFESSVYLIDYRGTNALTVTGDDLYSQEKAAEKFSQAKYDFEPVEKTAKKWIETVSKLQPMDMTSLGPGLLGGYTLLKMRSGGRLLLLTDGLANTGFGTLEGASATGKNFYKEAAGSCNLSNIIVDVVGVREQSTESQLALKTLGNLALETGGDIYYVTMEEIEKTFADIRGKGYIARNVEVQMFTPPALKLVDATGTASETLKPEEPIRLGGVTSDREIYFEMESAKEIKDEEVSIQAQIQYTDAEGKKHLRVVSKKVQRAKDEKEYVKTYEPEISGAMRVQQAGRAAYQGKQDKAEEIISGYQQQIAGAPMAAPKAASVNKALAGELNELRSRKGTSEDEATVGNAKQSRRARKELFK